MANNEKFNEATRVQTPALVHLHRLGYNYLNLQKNQGEKYDRRFFAVS